MAARILDGTAAAQAIRAELAPRVRAFTERAGRTPRLGIVLAGHDPGSEIYVRNKLKTAGEAGIVAELVRIPEEAPVEEVLAAVAALNARRDADGILVQSPLPEAMGADAETRVLDAIDPAKDVDGFTPANVGRLVQNRPGLVACTPAGIMELLSREQVAIQGARAVVIGRSDIVGKPMALLLLHRHATVTICHSRTRDLPAVARTADILVAAIGRPGFVTPEFVKPGAVVVDVGINSVSDEALVRRLLPPDSPRLAAFAKRGSLTVGDVHPSVSEVAGALTPVPGGVGPLTIAMLLANTVAAAEARLRA
ncbi:MAG TPA: bifunctional 5,10-methylenetetrahydrofolate dehydrogenase/5,10-methenyltetrahydrofolate cyclohydrolase [Vicinamibacterales bacterium]|nr:bifunctional 5,10-methylenetetrahydrofolate dehydrogenase/5,10-methenyltetrahydrofolate cyclohydrolase [Vicinamibacterales bacterium]HPW20919.1 bifunctional 5,10-methylenetetrahydrofolate dehydrogenase/5,10-methenyltetrahydrofolate cyclohydrolase [Vicinamibacterales bacterium]